MVATSEAIPRKAMMTAVTHPPSIRRPLPRLGDGAVVLALVLAATALTLVVDAGAVSETMRGGFGDPDDAMRLAEVRNWLSGQSWFDMTMARLDPPHGSVLHWSRLVDLPAAAFIRLFEVFANPSTAERLAAVAVPTVWLVALYFGMVRLATILVGPAGRWPALIGTFFSGATLVQFVPGRIGHHAPETVALVAAVATTVTALDPRRARVAFVCGALIAASLAMSLETLPFHAVLGGAILGFWVWDGAGVAGMLRWFAAGLLVALPLFFFMTVGPDHWLAPVCDAFGAAQLGAGLIGAAFTLALSVVTPRLPTRGLRLLAASLVGALALAYVRLAYPACLHSPFAGVDPLVRDLWLDHVVESESLIAFIRTRPFLAIAIVAPVMLGLAGSLFAATRLRGIDARRFMLVAALSAAGLALGFWQVRTLGSVTPIALCGGIYVVTWLRGLGGFHPSPRAQVFAQAAILPFCSTMWLLALPADARTPAQNAAGEAKAACLSPEGLAPLAALPPGTAVAPIDTGSHLLGATSLAVFAAPYHRNDDGNRFAFEVFLAAPDAARALLAARHVTYVITCPGVTDVQRLVARAPDGLASQLAAGKTPSFLVPQDLAATPYQVYRVRAGN